MITHPVEAPSQTAVGKRARTRRALLACTLAVIAESGEFTGEVVAARAGVSTATFYSHFTLEPKGRHIVRICDGTACHVKKSTDIQDALEKKLGLTGSKKTTDDGMFTLELVSCLGACGLAPVAMIGDHVHGHLKSNEVKKFLKAYK